MTGVVKMPRTYDATRRQEQAQENRARVLGAARARFLADGYTATTIPGAVLLCLFLPPGRVVGPRHLDNPSH